MNGVGAVVSLICTFVYERKIVVTLNKRDEIFTGSTLFGGPVCRSLSGLTRDLTADGQEGRVGPGVRRRVPEVVVCSETRLLFSPESLGRFGPFRMHPSGV